MHKLAVCLGEKNYLWIMVLLLLKTSGKRSKGKAAASSSAERLRQIQDLYSAFSSKTQVEGLLQMMVNLKRDAPEIRKIMKIPLKEDKGEVEEEQEEKMETDQGRPGEEFAEMSSCYLLVQLAKH